MLENFGIDVEKVCPACSSECPNLEIETHTIAYADAILDFIRFRRTVCKHAEICRKCWADSVRALNKLGNETPMRTVWGDKDPD